MGPIASNAERIASVRAPGGRAKANLEAGDVERTQHVGDPVVLLDEARR
jgi:hypothetical protein